MRWLVMVMVATGVAAAGPKLPAGTRFAHRCADHSCKSMVAVDAKGAPLAVAPATGWTPADIQAMYAIDPSLGDGITVAVVDAYGYRSLEADLATYRSRYGLPPCKIATGCLTIVNNTGDTSPLRDENGPDWVGETALDVQMVSAVCPKCRILVVQTDTNQWNALEVGEVTAAKLRADVISDSWGGAEATRADVAEYNFQNPGIGTFVSSGDDGWAPLAQYPSSSQFVIAVGGVTFDGVTTTAWSGAGSGCSDSIAKPVWSPIETPCTMRGTTDISAIADPATGVSVYISSQGGWNVYGGTSAAAPISAALFAAAGHGDAGPAFVYAHRDAFTDVVGGSSGACGGSNICTGVAGWDGPTGLGTPNQAKLKAIGNVVGAGPQVAITYPRDGSQITPNVSVAVAPEASATWVEVRIDGERVGRASAEPWTVMVPPLADGPHTVTAIAYDLDRNSATATASVTVAAAAPPDEGICNAGRSSTSWFVLVIAGLVLTTRPRGHDASRSRSWLLQLLGFRRTPRSRRRS